MKILKEILKKNPVKLNEEHHIYIHDNGKFYNSVTGIIHNFKDDFVKPERMMDKYHLFVQWFNNAKDKHKYNILDVALDYFSFRGKTVVDGIFNRVYTPKLATRYVADLYETLDVLKDNNIQPEDVKIYIESDGGVMSDDAITKFWRILTDVATSYGSLVHLIMEQHINNKYHYHDLDYDTLISQAYEFYLEKRKLYLQYASKVNYGNYGAFDIPTFKQKVVTAYDHLMVYLGDFCMAERIMYSEEYELCGMTDKLILFETADNKLRIDIGDHKTNNVFDFVNKYKSTYHAPFSHLQCCSHSDYSLQAGMYLIMLQDELSAKGYDERHYTIGDKWVSYWNKKDETFSRIELSDLRSEAKLMREIYFEKLRKIKNGLIKKNMLTDVDEKYHSFIASKSIGILNHLETTGKLNGLSKGIVASKLMSYIEDFKTKLPTITN